MATTDEVPPLQLLIRDSEGTRIVPGPRSETDMEPGEPIASWPRADIAQYSPDGRFVAVVLADSVEIHNATDGSLVVSIPQAGITAISFSPKSSYLTTWHKKKGEDKNLIVWSIPSGEIATSYFQKTYERETWPTVQFSSDERIACRASPSVVHVFAGDSLSSGAIGTARVQNIAFVSLAPGPAPYRIAILTKETRDRPGAIMLYSYPDLDTPVASKTFFNVTSANFHWSPTGEALVLHAQSDRSSTNYYGDSHLYFLTSDGRKAEAMSPSKEGHVHDIAWNPSGREFVLIAGASPPCSTLYNIRGEAVFDFGVKHRSAARWSPQGRFLLLGGFSGMAGEMEFWDKNKKKTMGENEQDCVVTSAWSPCGRWMMTAAIHPRLRTDNCFRFFKYNGAGPLFTKPFETLYQVDWRPAPQGVYPDRPQSPRSRGPTREGGDAGAGAGGASASSRPPSKPKAAVYRPRGATGAISAMMQADRSGAKKVSPLTAKPVSSGLPIGAPPPKKSANQLKKEKQRAKKEAAAKAKEAEAAIAAATGGGAGAGAGAGAGTGGVSKAAAAKELKKLQKKLRQITALKTKGTELDDDQKSKVAGEPALLAEIAALEKLL